MIFMSSYFLGQLFHIWCDTSKKLIDEPYHFKDYYELEEKNPFDLTLIFTYYAFTSLSTVGFGDYAPRSNPERVFIALILLFGVAIFSLIMGIFIDILNEFNSFNRDDFAEEESLARFFGIFRRFNAQKPLPIEIMRKIEQFFAYKWTHDRNNAMKSDEDIAILSEIPEDVQHLIFNKFLFTDFLFKFNKMFTFSKPSIHSHAYYNWGDSRYAIYMQELLLNLSPI